MSTSPKMLVLSELVGVRRAKNCPTNGVKTPSIGQKSPLHGSGGGSIYRPKALCIIWDNTFFSHHSLLQPGRYSFCRLIW